MLDYQIIKANEILVETFINQLENGKIHFRYYQKRPFSIIKTHFATLMMIDKSYQPIAYGHLNKENNILWIGVAVADKLQNRGLGTIMMEELIAIAKRGEESEICLSVDKENFSAQCLYEKMGFIKVGTYSNYFIFRLNLT